MSVVSVLNGLTGVARYAGLERTGVTRAELACAVRAGEVLRVRNGWFAGPSAPPDVVRAVRFGGALTAASVAQLHELWTIADPLLHVRVRSTAGRLSSPEGDAALDRQRDGVCVHYRHDRVEVDGFGFHADRFEQDRERDGKLTLRGYLVVRISCRMVMFQRARVEAGLLALVRRGAHRWGAA